MIANYGYRDASGELCSGCSGCVKACPADLFDVLFEDPNDPMREEKEYQPGARW
jgi:formate hydrogenlyase subunit 6/NADH:ubiquinone oxidoreductase subunit I